jgi:hypothetical protein
LIAKRPLGIAIICVLACLILGPKPVGVMLAFPIGTNSFYFYLGETISVVIGVLQIFAFYLVWRVSKKEFCIAIVLEALWLME